MNKKFLSWTFLAICLPASAQQAAGDAADAAKATAFDIVKKYGQVDLTVPTSPAFSILGIAPTDVERPGTLRALGTSLLRGVDENGKAKTGLAIDVAPLSLVAPQTIRGGSDYAGHYFLQALTRTTVSLATTGAEGGAEGSKMALGVRVGVIDLGDPGEHYGFLVNCLRNQTGPEMNSDTNVNGLSAEAEKAEKEKVRKCNPKTQLALWAKPSLYIGYGKAWVSNSGKIGDNVPASSTWWATYSQGIDSGSDSLRVLVQLHATRKTDDRVEDPNDATKLLRQDSTLYIARLRAGQPTMHAFADAGQRKVKLAGDSTDSVRHLGAGAEFKLTGFAEGMWLQIAGVRESGYSSGKSVNKAVVSMKWGSEAVFDPGFK